MVGSQTNLVRCRGKRACSFCSLCVCSKMFSQCVRLHSYTPVCGESNVCVVGLCVTKTTNIYRYSQGRNGMGILITSPLRFAWAFMRQGQWADINLERNEHNKNDE